MIALFSLITKYIAKDLILKAIEKLLISVIGVSSGFQLWLVKFLGKDVIYDKIAEPLINAGIVEGKFQLEVQGNKVILIKIHEAENAQDYLSSVNDLLD